MGCGSLVVMSAIEVRVVTAVGRKMVKEKVLSKVRKKSENFILFQEKLTFLSKLCIIIAPLI